MERNDEDLLSRLDQAIDKGINYMYEHQFPNGEFCCYYAPDDNMQEWCVPDSTVFPSSVIASCFLKLKDRPKVSKMLSLTSNFLLYQMMSGGVWNYFTKWNPLFKYCPADVDCTALASVVLKALNVKFTDNTQLLLKNRNKKGLFYTWIVLRPSTGFNLSSLKTMGRELKRPFNTLAFWLKHEVGRNDVDAVVNANVLAYLGLSETTQPIVSYLLNVLQNNKEKDSDKWYKNPFSFYYFLSRSFSKVKELEPAKQIIIKQIYESINIDGGFGASTLDNAFAIATLLNLNHNNLQLDKAVNTLLCKQSEAGNWDRQIFYYSGPSKVVGWGSEEFTTAHCIEALDKYKTLILA